MSTTTQTYSVEFNPGASSRIATVLRRVPLVMFTAIFVIISVRYLAHPVHYAAEAGISFTSPGGITIARVGFAAFPLSFAILALTALFSARWRLGGLYMVLTVDCAVMAVRILGFQLDHSTASARLLVPEVVLLILAIVAIRLESAWLARVTRSRPPRTHSLANNLGVPVNLSLTPGNGTRQRATLMNMPVRGWTATLPLSDYGRVAHYYRPIL